MNIKDSYALIRIDDYIESPVEAQIFSTLDVLNSYWQISTAEKDRQKTPFVCHLGTFQDKRMLFEVRNAPNSSQRALEPIFPRCK